MAKTFTGRCACKKVSYEVTTDLGFVAGCHCLDCKHATGGEMATFFGAMADAFKVTSGKPERFDYVAESGKKLVRNFCPDCGSRLYTSDLESFPGMVFVTIGCIDDPTGIAPSLEMFTKRRLAWVKPLDIPQFPGMPTG